LNRFVIADPAKCIGCYTCEAGCVNVHEQAGLVAYPRLTVTHTDVAVMPVQCRACEDAPCEKVCPVKAIDFEDRFVQLNESTCVGCKMCSLVCPFGVITPYGTMPESEGLFPAGAYLHTMHDLPDELNLHPILAWSVGQRAVAVKCDLCHFREQGPECIRVCPTNALYMVNDDAIPQTNAEKREQAVNQLFSTGLDHSTGS